MRVCAMLLLVVAVSGCASIRARQRARDERDARRQQAAYDKEMERDLEVRRAAEVRAAEAKRQAEVDAYQDQLCLAPDTPEMVGFCAKRERDKDRAMQQAQWDRENALREQEIELQRQQVRAQEDQARAQEEQARAQQKENRRRAIRDAFAPKPSTSCTSTVWGNTVRTNCD